MTAWEAEHERELMNFQFCEWMRWGIWFHVLRNKFFLVPLSVKVYFYSDTFEFIEEL